MYLIKLLRQSEYYRVKIMWYSIGLAVAVCPNRKRSEWKRWREVNKDSSLTRASFFSLPAPPPSLFSMPYSLSSLLDCSPYIVSYIQVMKRDAKGLKKRSAKGRKGEREEGREREGRGSQSKREKKRKGDREWESERDGRNACICV